MGHGYSYRSMQAPGPYASQWGFHVALTGGCLYKDGSRKDADIVVYRVRQSTSDGDHMEFLKAMQSAIGLTVLQGYGNNWCTKCHYQGRDLDILYPEAARLPAGTMSDSGY